MAGVTNAPFRTLCRRFGAGLYVSEMITARALVEGDRKTQRLASFAPDEVPRSLQLYGVDPEDRGRGRGAPRGRGSRRPHRPQLRLSGAEGHAARRRRGDPGEAAPPREHRARRGRARGRRAGDAQVSHRHRRRARHVPRRGPHRRSTRAARRSRSTRAPRRSSTTAPPTGRPSRCSKQAVREHPRARQRRRVRGARRAADDARRPAATAWWSGAAASAARGCSATSPTSSRAASPRIRRARRRLRDHARARAAPRPASRARARRSAPSASTRPGTRRRFPGSARLRQRLLQVSTLAELDAILGELDPATAYPPEAMRVPRGKHGGTQRVALPEGFLDALDDDTPPGPEAEDPTSGG